MNIDIISSSGEKLITTLNVEKTSTILDIKKEILKFKKKYNLNRQEIRLEPKSKGLKDSDTVESLNLQAGGKVYLKDLGPQIGWSTVFFCEYAGPLILYMWIYQRPWLFYGDDYGFPETSDCAKIAAGCWAFHYAKRLLETKFVHRFSHATMPVFNLFKNSLYYWGFSVYVAYHVNHPLFTPPSDVQVYSALGAFLFCEFGNFSIHWALRNLRPAGSTERRIPEATRNPFTVLFNFVSCPNYTYETGAWVAFAVMTQCLPAALFGVCGFYQMLVWALGKHKNYKKEFPTYSKFRKAIIPFVI